MAGKPKYVLIRSMICGAECCNSSEIIGDARTIKTPGPLLRDRLDILTGWQRLAISWPMISAQSARMEVSAKPRRLAAGVIRDCSSRATGKGLRRRFSNCGELGVAFFIPPMIEIVTFEPMF